MRILFAAMLAVASCTFVGCNSGSIDDEALVEGVRNVRRMAQSSLIYFDFAGAFPASAGPTPETTWCEGDPHGAPAESWREPTWLALNFMMSDPHYFSYQYESSGTGPESTFTAAALIRTGCEEDSIAITYSGGPDAVISSPWAEVQAGFLEIPDAIAPSEDDLQSEAFWTRDGRLPAVR